MKTNTHIMMSTLKSANYQAWFSLPICVSIKNDRTYEIQGSKEDKV